MDRRKFVKSAVIGSMGAVTASSFGCSRFGLSKKQTKQAVGSSKPLATVVDLNIDETATPTLYNGTTSKIKLLSLQEEREPVFNTLIATHVKVEINDKEVELISGSYRLPVTVEGVQIDVPTVYNYMKDSSSDRWGLKKSARIRLWPEGSPWIEPGKFKYPVKQRWAASRTWFSNEPVSPRVIGKVYYHSGMDIGGVDGLTEVISATDGKVISLGNEIDGEKHPAIRPRYDVVYIEDYHDRVYRYSHLSSIDPNLVCGEKVKMGQRIGFIGKEGSSGGWSHLHFHIESLQPSGLWSVEDSYPYLWQSYIEEHDPAVIAVARPHIKTLPGKTVLLDASRSWAKSGIESFSWQFMDGSSGDGAMVTRSYDRPGTYSEIVKVTDNKGNFDYDFIRVVVYPEPLSESNANFVHSVPRVHAAYHPTFNIKPGDPVIFRSRGFGPPISGGIDIYDFGDGSPKVEVPSNIDSAQHAANGYGTILHHYKKPGHYIVKVNRIDNETGNIGIEHLHIIVDGD